jgi:hypothetical protein
MSLGFHFLLFLNQSTTNTALQFTNESVLERERERERERESISTSVQYVTLQTIFLTSKF